MNYRQRLTRKLWHYKRRKGCARCGYNKHGLALDFAHVNPEEKSHWMYKNGPVGSGMGVLVSRIPKYGSQLHKDRMRELKEEIRKCIVICKNCHVIETYENREMHGGHKLHLKRKGVPEKEVASLEGLLF
jgi:hypothetical protein|tara:strand:- start:277 stop:666 length:390 start_codon:yes stop_codon:yes gene_type:complete